MAVSRARDSLSVQYPRPSHFLLHVSDTHFVARKKLYGRVDVEEHLARMLGAFEESDARPEAIIITGDLADTGDPVAYARLRAIVEPAALRLNARIVWVMGNHDSRPAFRVGLLDEEPSIAPVDQVLWLGGLRIIALDTTVPGRHHGLITDAQLTWLREELAVPAPEGTILAMHHPPVPSVLDLAVTVELQEQNKLAEVLTGSGVRSILAGHLHYSTTAMFAGIQVSVASASCYTQDLTAPRGGMRSRDGGQAINLVHVYDHTVMHSVAPLGRYPVLSTISPEAVAIQLEESGLDLDALSTAPVSHGAAIAK